MVEAADQSRGARQRDRFESPSRTAAERRIYSEGIFEHDFPRKYGNVRERIPLRRAFVRVVNLSVDTNIKLVYLRRSGQITAVVDSSNFPRWEVNIAG